MGAYYRKLLNGLVKQTEPDDMTTAEIHEVIDMFVKAAVRAQAGRMGRKYPQQLTHSAGNSQGHKGVCTEPSR